MSTTSKLVKHQTKTFSKTYAVKESIVKHVVTVRYDDECNNGHNSFAITSDIKEYTPLREGEFKLAGEMGGCCHDEVRVHFPELAPYLKWHLVNSDEPMGYIANTLYWLGYSGWGAENPNAPPNIEHARSTAVWPDMPEDFICHPDARMLKITRDAAATPVKEALTARLPQLMADFRHDVEELGFTF